jgi:hypothetical protein
MDHYVSQVGCDRAVSVSLLAFPDRALVPVWPSSMPGLISSSMFVGAGAVVGLLIGCVLRWAWQKALPQESSELFAVVPALGFIGTVLGWQAVLSIATFFCGLMLLRILLIGRNDGVLISLLAALMIHHLLWRVMSDWPATVWPHASSTLTAVILPLLTLAACVVVIRRNTFSVSGDCQRTACL